MILEVLAGIITGLILAPLFFMALGMLAYNRTQKKHMKRMNEMRENHKRQINNIKKEYEKKHTKYMKLRTKMIKYIDKTYEKHKGVKA